MIIVVVYSDCVSPVLLFLPKSTVKQFLTILLLLLQFFSHACLQFVDVKCYAV